MRKWIQSVSEQADRMDGQMGGSDAEKWERWTEWQRRFVYIPTSPGGRRDGEECKDWRQAGTDRGMKDDFSGRCQSQRERMTKTERDVRDYVLSLRRRRDNWSPLLAMAEGYEEKTLVAC